MRQVVPLADAHLLTTISKFPAEFRNDDSKRSFWLAIAVIKHYLSELWLDEHVSPERTSSGFLRVIAGESEATQISTFKIIDFAELLWNLQGVAGISTCIKRLVQGVIESTYAEMDFGRMLYCGGVDFRFVAPQQKKGSDYDIEITLADGTIVCADAKCKVEATDFSIDTVRHSLEKARRQLPNDRPGIIFMKVPSRWIKQPTPSVSLTQIAENFLSTTKRIVSVKFYFSDIVYDDKFLRHDHAFKEISNPNNRFDRARDWDMFAEPQIKRGWNGMPPRWRRLLFFPNEGPHEH
jgi:hypothetical protein